MDRAHTAPLGLAALALTTWMWSMLNAGWYSMAGLGFILALALAYGGLMQVIAGLWEYRRGNTLAGTAFLSYGAFWWAAAVFGARFSGGATRPLVAWALLLWGAIFFIVWLAGLRRDILTMLVYLALWIMFALLAIGLFSATAAITHLGGYVGLIAAVLALYAAAARLVNHCHGRSVLPYGDSA